jgi:surface polysaccharide O-acyltransferase-like enzyme
MQAATQSTKINYIDNLRVLLTILVILHHTCITYGAPGGWYFYDKTSNETALIPMTWFVATNQSFFMGLFFFLAALFTESSYIRKGAVQFSLDRLKRLGLPLLFYFFILSPVLNFLTYRFGYHNQGSLMQYLKEYDNEIGPGVMWFVAALLIFTFLYVLYMQLFIKKERPYYAFPGNKKILVFALTIGVITYLVRLFFPVGRVLDPLSFQFAHFTQYIGLFIAGIAAGRYQWLNEIDRNKGKRWTRLAVIMVTVFPLLYIIKILSNSPLDAFQGHGSWQSFLAVMWEQFTGISIIMALLVSFKYKWNYTTPVLKNMSRAAFATYILHPLAVISIALLLKHWQTEPALKLLVAAPLVVAISFLLGMLVVRLPVVKNVV